jgi:hypothetical protein
LPKLGAANTPYARTVRPRTLQPATLPEPEVLFDSIMVRKKFEEHPNKISSVMFYLASIIIHGMLANPCYAAIILLTAPCVRSLSY